jgi:hypothetical protein
MPPVLALLFAPSVVLMGRLRYAAKFVLITLLFCGPLLLGAWQYYHDIDYHVAFARAEMQGNRALLPLLHTLSELPQQERSGRLSPRTVDGRRDGLLAQIQTIGDSSNLILDPDLDTFYLMDTIVDKLPHLGALLIDARRRTEGQNSPLNRSVVSSQLRAARAEIAQSLDAARRANPSVANPIRCTGSNTP